MTPTGHDADSRDYRLLTTLEQVLSLETRSFPDAFAQARELIGKALGADTVDVLLYDAAGLSLVAAEGSDTPRGRRQRGQGLHQSPLTGSGQAGEVFPLGIASVTARAAQGWGERVGLTRGLGLQSLMVVPLEIGGHRRGVVRVASAQPDIWSEADLRFLAAVARLLGLLALGEREERLRSVIAQAPVGLFALDRTGIITLSEGQALAALGLGLSAASEGSAVGGDLDARPEVAAGVRRALAGEACAGEVTLGQSLFEVRYLPVRDGQGAVESVIGVATDITDRAQAEQALRHQVLHDPLTGLPNRTLLHDRLAQALRVAQREQRPLAVLILDLDRFKAVNDRHGHYIGDGLLRLVRPRLHRVLRSSDTVARLGGDEFAVLLPNANQDGAVRVAPTIHAALAAPFVVEGQTLQVGLSIGIALYPTHGREAATLLRHADSAMYRAKRARSNLAVYKPAQDRHKLAGRPLVPDDLPLPEQPASDSATA